MGLLFKQPIHNLSSYFRLLTSATSRPLMVWQLRCKFLLFGRSSLDSARPFRWCFRKQRCVFGSVSRFLRVVLAPRKFSQSRQKARIIFDPGASLFTLIGHLRRGSPWPRCAIGSNTSSSSFNILTCLVQKMQGSRGEMHASSPGELRTRRLRSVDNVHWRLLEWELVVLLAFKRKHRSATGE